MVLLCVNHLGKGDFFPKEKFTQSFIIMTLLKHQGPNMEMYALRRTRKRY